jgi:RimJ/RimL family protein N-acetyltransferase
MLSLGHTLLRPAGEKDLVPLMELRNDVALQGDLLSTPRGSSLSATREWVTRRTLPEGALFFVIARAEDDSAVGFIQLENVHPIHRHAHLGVALSRAARGVGHGSAAIRLLERHAHDVLGVRKVLLEVKTSNTRAVTLYERLGYERVGVLRAHFYLAGTFHDVTVMEKQLETRPHE